MLKANSIKKAPKKFHLAMKDLSVLIYSPFLYYSEVFYGIQGMRNLLGEDDDNMSNTLRSAPLEIQIKNMMGGTLRPCRNSVCVAPVGSF